MPTQPNEVLKNGAALVVKLTKRIETVARHSPDVFRIQPLAGILLKRNFAVALAAALEESDGLTEDDALAAEIDDALSDMDCLLDMNTYREEEASQIQDAGDYSS